MKWLSFKSTYYKFTLLCAMPDETITGFIDTHAAT